MNEKKRTVLYIDDELASREVFSDVLEDLYNDRFTIQCIEPEQELQDMIEVIGKVPNLTSIIIDERLSISARTNYKGSELSEELRNIYEIIPIYILTSHPSSLEPICGSVEYVLDKGQLETEDYKSHVKNLLSRHVANTDILVTEKRKKYDQLLAKSMSHPLTEDELKELESLELFRVKPLFNTESFIGERDLELLNENAHLLDELQGLLGLDKK
ncbi:response regulator [Vibrio diabolicus]|uniref:response regulator n=1 Tax=Vibrio diabolicus TaxID=50719 RepID=UPI002160D85D|nr:response regulator [Vibrio diabolicus]MCS0362989.1 response regulator [Vibrio diabolicus]